MQKSMSISGIEMRSGFRKRSNSSSCCERIDVGDAQRIGDQGSRRRSASRPHRNVVLFGVADEVPDDQEVSRELHLLNDGDFARQPLLVVRNGVLQPPLLLQIEQGRKAPREAFAGYVLEIAVESEARRHVEVRERAAHFLELQIAALGDVKRAR